MKKIRQEAWREADYRIFFAYPFTFIFFYAIIVGEIVSDKPMHRQTVIKTNYYTRRNHS